MRALNHTNTFLTWADVESRARSQNGGCNKADLDGLVADVIRSVATEMMCNTCIKRHDDSKRSITICGEECCVASVFEVTAMCDDTHTMQLVSLTQNKASRVTDHSCINRVVPQIACESLAVARYSIFGDDDVKIVYHVSIHRRDDEYQLFLTRSHISTNSLDAVECKCQRTCTCSLPIGNPLVPSYVFYTAVPDSDFRTMLGFEYLYRAVKAIFIFFKEVSKKRKAKIN
ncbi:uncharacterized protein LOC144434782 [Glandiceps talaboti]